MAMARIVQLLTVAYPLAASVSMRKKIAGDAALSIAANGTGTTLLEGDQQAIAALSAELPHRLDDAPMFVLELPTNDLSRTRLKRLREHSPAGTLNNLSFVDGINAASIADKEGLLESSTAQLIFVRQQRDCEVSSLADAVKHTSLMLGEVACWLGHAKVWEIVAEKVPPKSWAIVLEDDVDFTKTARRMLHDLRVRPTSKSRPPLVFLETRQCPYGAGTSEWPSVWSETFVMFFLALRKHKHQTFS
eukprot:TRINITY_DN4924_c0_g1_i2.p1 TRINITY_DN4924_c0_g1~~TRINITY_DN4924_c0_g1_i2.p1  ORF type:complete len:247 (-),score=45.93 TRINITY_DN4924_c0_g1_i2:603-1343(-)